MPSDIAHSLQRSRVAGHAWKSLPAKSQGKLLESLEGAKDPRTRQRKIKEVIKKSKSEFIKRATGAGY